MLTQTPTLLAMGFGLGLLHALDPDHVLAVANLNDARAGRRGSLAFSARWALGHGAALMDRRETAMVSGGVVLGGHGWLVPGEIFGRLPRHR